MRTYRFRLALVALLCVVSAPVEAQATAAAALAFGGLDQILSRVETINIYYGGSLGNPTETPTINTRLPWSKQFGFELSLHVGQYGKNTAVGDYRRREADEKLEQQLGTLRDMREGALRMTSDKATRDSITKAFVSDSAKLVKTAAASFTTSSILVKKHLAMVPNAKGDSSLKLVGIDSEFTISKTTEKGSRLVDLDLGIGYSQLDGIVSTAPFDLRGYVRELPSISVYLTLRATEWLGVYSGVRTGIISLQDAQFVVPKEGGGSSLFSLTATTFEFGGPLGIDLRPFEGVHLTVEADYNRRRFNSLTYNPAVGLPALYPRSFDVSGFSWNLGIQFPIPAKSS